MPKSYSIYNMKAFPNLAANEIRSIPRQLTLDGIAESATSEFQLVRQLHALNVDVCKITHEMVVHRAGRANGKAFTEFVLMHYLWGFYAHNLKVFIVQGEKKVARDAFRLLDKRIPDLKGESRKLDLRSINPLIRRYRGAWFSYNSPGVSAQALFGADVGEDPLFHRAQSEGNLNSIMIPYEFESQIVLINVSSDYGVVIYTNHLSEEEEIRLIIDVKHSLLDKAKDKS